MQYENRRNMNKYYNALNNLESFIYNHCDISIGMVDEINYNVEIIKELIKKYEAITNDKTQRN